MRIKDMVIEERVKELERRIKLLEDRLLNLEFPPSQRVYGPVIDPRQVNIKQTCPVCNLNLDGVLGYSCTNINCPTGLGPITS